MQALIYREIREISCLTRLRKHLQCNTLRLCSDQATI